MFFPCLPPTESHRVFKRLSSDLESYSPQLMSVEFGALFHPILATGILSGEFSMMGLRSIGEPLSGVPPRSDESQTLYCFSPKTR